MTDLRQALLIAAEAKLKERNRWATTHCQCEACKNGNIHDSDCSVHNGDALPVGPCDCSLATPPQQQAEPVQEPYESPYNPTPVEYQYHYPNGLWRCSNGEVINGLQPDRARSLYALKDNT